MPGKYAQRNAQDHHVIAEDDPLAIRLLKENIMSSVPCSTKPRRPAKSGLPRSPASFACDWRCT